MAPAGGTFSSSAVGTLVASKAILEKDKLLALIVNVMSPRQIKVEVKTGKNVQMELTILNNSTKIVQRAAIIRGLCGAALLNALDGAPWYLLGGNATPGSPTEAVQLASISSWMSVASGKARGDSFWQALDRHLESRAFLTPSGSCTIADLDLALTLFPNETAYNYHHVTRWLQLCHAVCTRMAAAATTSAAGKIDIPAMAVAPVIKPPAPIFFYEWEPNALPKPPKAAATGGGANQKQGGGGGGGKNQQQQQQQQGGKKKDKAANKAAAPAPAAAGADLDISALNIVVGKITKVWEHEKADKLFCEEIDCGEESGPRSIASGLRPFYKAEEMEGKMVLVLANLKARPLMGFKSHGMVLCSSNADHTKVEIVSPSEGTKIGERVSFEGYAGDPKPENQVAKKKIFEKLAPDLKTTSDGTVVWKEAKATTSAGIITGMPDGQVA